MGFPSGSAVKYLPAVQEMQETQVWSLGWEDSLEEERATHSSGSHSHWPGRSHDRGTWAIAHGRHRESAQLSTHAHIR